MLERQTFREKTRAISICNNIVRKPSIVLDTRHLLILAESHIGQITLTIIPTSTAIVACMSKIKHADPLANLPALAGFITESYNSSDWFV